MLIPNLVAKYRNSAQLLGTQDLPPNNSLLESSARKRQSDLFFETSQNNQTKLFPEDFLQQNQQSQNQGKAALNLRKSVFQPANQPKKTVQIQEDVKEKEQIEQNEEKRKSALKNNFVNGKIQKTTDDNNQIVEQENKNEQEQAIDVFQIKDEKNKYEFLNKILDHNLFSLFITMLTLFALFGDDIRTVAFSQGADIYFDIISITALIFFYIEIIISIFAKNEYLFSFFFWLDMISTISIIFDIQLLNVIMFTNKTVNTASLARAGRASRVGTKAGRVVRLVRLIRIVKLYKATQEQKQKQIQINQEISSKKKQEKHSEKNDDHKSNNELNTSEQHNKEKQDTFNVMGTSIIQPENQFKDADFKKSNLFKESRVSKKLLDLTTKRVIIVVLLLLFTMPLFSADYFFDLPLSADYLIAQLADFCQNKANSHDEIVTYINLIVYSTIDTELPIVYLKAPFSFTSVFQDPVFNSLRDSEKQAYSSNLYLSQYQLKHPQDTYEIQYLQQQKQDDLQFICYTNNYSTIAFTAALSIGRTVFVCIVLTLASLFFSKDANDLALRPIERMIIKVNEIAKNPISAKEQELLNSTEDKFETLIIENAIIKIGVLLALGFGEAGSEIIASNMAKLGDVNPMLAGRKKCAIYGFCDIRSFTDATEVLQEDVMFFVNNIGEVVHQMVDRYMGAANKNIGDAFLLVWKLPEGSYQIRDGNVVEYKDQQIVSMYGEFSLISFMKIYAKLNREPKLLAYRNDKRLIQRMQNYKIKMGFGLHIGWSIEGAIGSEFKIDASYLSQNVNMSNRLEAATKQYGVPLLISSKLFEIFTPSIKKYIRQIDFVFIKGWNEPLGLFTIDMNVDGIPPSKDDNENYTKQEKKFLEKQKKLTIKEFITNRCFHAETYLRKNKDLSLLMKYFDPNFHNLFQSSFSQYQQGDWLNAKIGFEKCLQKKRDDGPTLFLYKFMENNQFKVPQNWDGKREFSD